MAIPVRRPRTDRTLRRPAARAAGARRPGLRLREVTLGFGLVAILLCGTAVMARAAMGDTADVPAAVLAVAGGLLVSWVLVRAARRRRPRAVPPVTAAPVGAVATVTEAAGEPAAYVADDLVEDLVEEPAVQVDYTALDADAFEQAVADLCVRDGCLDVEVVGGAGDLGADVVATAPDGRRVVIQCKAYGPDNKVGSQDLQRFGGTCFAVHEAHVAAVVTTSEFTEPAAQYAAQCGILCVDGPGLDAWTDGTGPAPWLQAPLQGAGC
ncbi:restriction endonuclease [Streptomyces lavendulocolor]|uniref:restriction endonuclease n=1 Tax=Streptomyces lavendulocolor TaxID=67316 RepID=UPI003C2B3F73